MRKLKFILFISFGCARLASGESGCVAEDAAVTALRTRLDQHQQAAARLGFRDWNGEFDRLTNSSDAQLAEMKKARLDSILSIVLAGFPLAPKAKTTLNQPGLPNGLLSLNPINVNKVVNKLDNPNGPTARLLRNIAATSKKETKLEFIDKLIDVAGKEKSVYDASDASYSLRSYLKTTSAILELYGFGKAATVLNLPGDGADVALAYGELASGKDTLLRLEALTAANVQALAKITALMKRDVSEIKRARTELTNCQDNERARIEAQSKRTLQAEREAQDRNRQGSGNKSVSELCLEAKTVRDSACGDVGSYVSPNRAAVECLKNSSATWQSCITGSGVK